ncbi:MAG: serine hydrolase [Bacteroidota bacterium]
MKHTLLIALCFLLCAPLFAQKDKRFKDLDKEYEELLEVSQAAGFAVAIVEGDQIIYAKGFGFRDYENKKPVDANTLFAIGSSTKAFTSAILGQLRDDEKLSFDDSPIEHMPFFSFYNDEMNNSIIIQDLMCHRTGLPRHDFSWYMFPTNNRDSLLMRVKYQEPFTGVRQQWYYNNFMFLAQGVIAEKITGKSWEDNVRERFFKPLGMERSNCTIQEMKDASNASYGYSVKEDKIVKEDYYDIAAMAPAGSINSSVNDMTKWAALWIKGGKFNGEEILSPTYTKEAMGSHMVVNQSGPGADRPDLHFGNYGYGWFLSSYKGHYRVEHGGNIDGFSANVAFYPSDSVGVIVLANQNGSPIPSIARNLAIDRALGLEQTDWIADIRSEEGEEEQEEASAEKGNVKGTKPSHILMDYTGSYFNPGYGKFSIKLENDSLFADLALMRLYLKHYHYDVFQPMEVTEQGVDTTDGGFLMFNFGMDNNGDITHLTAKIEPTVDPIQFDREVQAIEVETSTLEAYVGEFELAGMTIKSYIKDENTLYLFVPGQPEYELVPTGPNKFNFKILEGFKVEFLEGEEGKFDSVKVIQPNGTFVAKRK